MEENKKNIKCRQKSIYDNISSGLPKCRSLIDDESKRLITMSKRNSKYELVNDLTKFMDSMAEINIHPDFCTTYLYINKADIFIRFPGATRGMIYTNDNNIITDIMLYEETCFDKGLMGMRYKKELAEEIKKFIGC